MRPLIQQISFSILILCLLGAGVWAQTEQQIELDSAAYNVQVWSGRVNELAREIEDDSGRLPGTERAMYLAYLAKALWEQDANAARSALDRSSKVLESSLEPESDKVSPRRLEFARTALGIIFQLDENLGHETISEIERETRSAGTDDALADFFVAIGLVAVKKDPHLAEACALRSLSYGLSAELPALIVEINLKDPSVADELVRRTLRRLQGSTDDRGHLLLYNLHRYAQEFNRGQSFSNNSQISILSAFADALALAASIEELRPQRCGLVFFAPNLVGHMERMLPARLVEFRQNIQTCIPYTSDLAQGIARSASGEEVPRTVEELLKAAVETHDVELKVRHFRNALSILEREKQFDRMVSVLDGLPGDDYKKASPIGWSNWRIGAAVGGALEAFSSGDLPGIYRFIDKTPAAQRPIVRMRLVNDPEVQKDESFLIDNLERVQKEIDALSFSDRDAVRVLLELTEHYLAVRPIESVAKLRRASMHINGVDNDNPDYLPEKDWAPMEDRVRLNAELFEVDEIGLRSALRDISSRRSRVRLKLGLIESTLRKLQTAEEMYRSLVTKAEAGVLH